MKLLIVDDSMLIRSMLNSLIKSFEGFEVIGEASTGKKAITAVKELKPDLVLMDINMPEMDGITATEIIMRENPLPIIIFTSEDVAEVGYRALNVGALEIIPKPDIHQMNNPEFIRGFKTILEHVVRYGGLKISEKRNNNHYSRDTFSKNGLTTIGESGGNKNCAFITIGASTGGPSAVRTLLSALPENFPVPILLTQHIEIGFDIGYAEWLNDGTPLYVRIAKQHDIPKAGEVLVAPATHHLICRDKSVFWDDGPRVGNQKPSIDKMFYSASMVYGDTLVGVLLTGMGMDGAKGCRMILDSGGKTLVQDKESSMIFGMPKAAIEMNAASLVLPLTEIAKELILRCM